MRTSRRRKLAKTTSIKDVVYFSNKISYPRTYHLSPFFICKFNLNDKWWKSVIHYYQANKCEVDDELYTQINECESPEEAKRLGGSITPNDHWVNNKVMIMRDATYAKFSQNKNCMNVLINTGNKSIMEMSQDNFWGGKNNGHNMMGHILMEVRVDIRKKLRLE